MSTYKVVPLEKKTKLPIGAIVNMKGCLLIFAFWLAGNQSRMEPTSDLTVRSTRLRSDLQTLVKFASDTKVQGCTQTDRNLEQQLVQRRRPMM